MAINGGSGNGLPAPIINVIEQQNYLETKLRKSLHAKLVLRKAAATNKLNENWFEGRIGETKTFTRSNPIAPNTSALSPSNNSGLDNGISPRTRSFEQWQAVLNEYVDGININVLGNETLLGDLYIDDMVELASAAGNAIEVVCVQNAMKAYDSGDTFVTTAVTGATIHVDNVNGFGTQYNAGAGTLGLPQPVGAANTLAIMQINSSGAVVATSSVSGVTADGSNTSIMQTGGVAFGASGNLALTSSLTCAVGDRIVAMDPANATLGSTSNFNPVFKDSAQIVRPLSSGAMLGTARALTASSTCVPSVSIPQMVSILARRQVPRLPNGLYGCLIDSTLLGQFYNDSGFQTATMGTFDKSPVFENGIIAKGWGVEFVEATQLPVYLHPTGGFPIRHAFCFGADVISEHPFRPMVDATNRPATMGSMFDIRFEDRIEFITQTPLDRLGEVVKMSYKYVGDFEPGTDKGSNPTIVFTSDYCRYKRGIVGQFASAI